MRQHRSIRLMENSFAFHIIMFVIWNIGVGTTIFAAPPNIKHTMLISGTGLDYVGIVDTTGKLVWKHAESELASGNGQKNDSWLLPDGNVAYAYQWGIRIVDIKTNKVIWDRQTPKRNGQTGETHSCQPLDGRSDKFLVPECFNDTAFIVEVDTTGKEWRRIGLLKQGDGAHGKWRQIRKTKNDSYLLSSMSLFHSYEYDTTGHLIHDFPAGGYVAERLDNGNTITGTGDNSRIVEFNSAGAQVWEVNNSTVAISGVGIGFASEVQRLSNGNTIITNWGGHGTGFGAAVIEILPDRSVIGAVPDSFPTKIASVKIIDGWNFQVKQFSITANVGSNGTIFPSGTVLVDSATNKTFTITANSGYAIDSVKVDDVNMGAVDTYTFTTIKASHTIEVTFKKNVSTSRSAMRKIWNGTPLITVARGGTISLLIPYSGTTFIRVFDCHGRMVAEQTAGNIGNCTLPKIFTNGIYTVALRNASEEKKWSRTVVVKER
jgi:hypothetical protein